MKTLKRYIFENLLSIHSQNFQEKNDQKNMSRLIVFISKDLETKTKFSKH